MEFLEIPQKKTLAELGLDIFAQSPLVFSGSEINAKAGTMYDNSVPSNFIQDGDTIVRLNMIDGWLQSNEFVTGSAGWRIDSDGNIEANNGVFRGSITASTINIGTNGWHVDTSGNMWWGSSATFAGATIKISTAGVASLGTVNSGTFTGGTFTGNTIQTATTGYRAVMTSSNGYQVYNGATWQGEFKADTAASVIINSAGNIYLQSNGNQMAHITTTAVDLPGGHMITWAGQGRIYPGSGGLKVEGSTGGTWGLRVEGHVFPDSNENYDCGTNAEAWDTVYAQNFQNTSARYKKKNIVNLKNCLDIVNGLKPRRFVWKKSKNKAIGFIADEMLEVIPEIVKFDRDGIPATISYDKITAVLVGAVKEQQKQLDKLSKAIGKHKNYNRNQ